MIILSLSLHVVRYKPGLGRQAGRTKETKGKIAVKFDIQPEWLSPASDRSHWCAHSCPEKDYQNTQKSGGLSSARCPNSEMSSRCSRLASVTWKTPNCRGILSVTSSNLLIRRTPCLHNEDSLRTLGDWNSLSKTRIVKYHEDIEDEWPSYSCMSKMEWTVADKIRILAFYACHTRRGVVEVSAKAS